MSTGSTSVGNSALAHTPSIDAITITNLTRGQSFTPILVSTDMRDFTMFTTGSAPTAALSFLAESGDIAPMSTVLQASGMV